MSSIIIWSVAAIALFFVAADVLKDRRRERRIDQECAEFVKILDKPW